MLLRECHRWSLELEALTSMLRNEQDSMAVPGPGTLRVFLLVGGDKVVYLDNH